MTDIKPTSELIAQVWKCKTLRYPETAGMNDDQRMNYLVKHSLLHIGVTVGKISKVCQARDHKKEFTEEERKALKHEATALFVNSLKLAEEVGLTPEELVAQAPSFVR